MGHDGAHATKTVLQWTIGIATVAFILLLMAIIFGNLSGNTGIPNDSVSVVNESGGFINTTGYTLAGASDTGAAGFSITAAHNTTANVGTLIGAGNYTVSAAGVVTNASATAWPDVNFTYDYTRSSQATLDAEGIITNYTSSAVNTAAQFPTVGTILGVALLILILLALLVFVISRMGGLSGRGSGESKRSFEGGNFG